MAESSCSRCLGCIQLLNVTLTLQVNSLPCRVDKDSLLSVYYLGGAPDFQLNFRIPGDRGTKSVRGVQRLLSLTTYMGRTFTAYCRVWIIMSEVTHYYYSDKAMSPSDRMPLAFAYERYQRLVKWVGDFPAAMARGNHTQTTASTTADHLCSISCHAAILDIFRAFIPNKKQHGFQDYSPSMSSLKAIFTASVRQLKRQIFLHRARYRSASYCLFWNLALLYVANAALRF